VTVTTELNIHVIFTGTWMVKLETKFLLHRNR